VTKRLRVCDDHSLISETGEVVYGPAPKLSVTGGKLQP
jgi:hypothetical protein